MTRLDLSLNTATFCLCVIKDTSNRDPSLNTYFMLQADPVDLMVTLPASGSPVRQALQAVGKSYHQELSAFTDHLGLESKIDLVTIYTDKNGLAIFQQASHECCEEPVKIIRADHFYGSFIDKGHKQKASVQLHLAAQMFRMVSLWEREAEIQRNLRADKLASEMVPQLPSWASKPAGQKRSKAPMACENAT